VTSESYGSKALSAPIKILVSAVVLLLVVVALVATAEGGIDPVVNSLNSTEGMDSEVF
jgi:hypothetical protein